MQSSDQRVVPTTLRLLRPLIAVLDVGCVTIFASSVFITPRKTSLGTRTFAATRECTHDRQLANFVQVCGYDTGCPLGECGVEARDYDDWLSGSDEGVARVSRRESRTIRIHARCRWRRR